MALQITMLTVALATAAALGVLVLGALKLSRRKKYRLPPGPSGVPFFGNLSQLDKACPHGSITDWSDEYGDVMKIKLFGNEYVVLSSFEAIYEALVTKETEFAGRPWIYRTRIVGKYGEDIGGSTYSRSWMYRKKTTMQALKMYGDNPENLELTALDWIKDMNEELRSIVEVEGTVNLKPTILSCVTGIVTSIMYGHKISTDDVEALIAAQSGFPMVLAPTGLGVLLDKAPILRYVLRKTHSKLIECEEINENWFKHQISNRKKIYQPGNPQCFVDALFETQRKFQEGEDEYQLTDDVIGGIHSNMIFAGIGPASTTLISLIAVLVNKLDIQQKMADVIEKEISSEAPHLRHRERLPYIEAAIFEVLRYSSITPLSVLHSTMTDTDVKGYDIQKDTRIMFNLWKLHHSPEYWDEPWEFKPERFLDRDGNVVPPDHINRKRLLPFGAGIRGCMGTTLTRNMLFLMVTSLIQNFQFLPVSEDKRPSHDPRTYVTVVGSKPQEYSVKLLPRVCSQQ